MKSSGTHHRNEKSGTAIVQNDKVFFFSRFTDEDIALFKEGKNFRLYDHLGSFPMEHEGVSGCYFSVWAPNATYVSVLGDFNQWNRLEHKLFERWDSSGIWEGFIPGVGEGESYKYFILSRSGSDAEKGDPYARFWEHPPETNSRVWKSRFNWTDEAWMRQRHTVNSLTAPVSVYEVHLGSWKKKPDGSFLSYLELIPELVPYVKEMGFTHVEFMPVMEHPFYGSWGYQIHGYFAPSSRFGNPDDLKALINAFHEEGIGVILDWVPSHFPGDEHGLYRFDGTALYEHEDPRKGYHPDWNSHIFNYGRYEVRDFLISNALFWLEEYHADGLRVDAVASMLFLDYSRGPGEWMPNIHGGNENLDAIFLIRQLNEMVRLKFPDTLVIAEESTIYPNITRSVAEGGLGFDLKWMLGWMHDTLLFFSKDPIYRKYHHGELTQSFTYTFSERYILPLSHDEVVHGKGSLIGKMFGDEWQRFANLRALYACMYTHPGAKLLFMGAEIAQYKEWSHDSPLDWHLLQYPYHQGIQSLLKDLNQLYREKEALFARNYELEGFQLLVPDEAELSILAYLRKGELSTLLVTCNLTPMARKYWIGLPSQHAWKEVLNTDRKEYGGGGICNPGEVKPVEKQLRHMNYAAEFILAPLSVQIFETEITYI